MAPVSEVDRFAEFFRMLGYELEDFQQKIVEEIFSPERETLVLIPRGERQVHLAGRRSRLWSLLRGRGQQIVVGAASREQASVLFDMARSMAAAPRDRPAGGDHQAGDPHRRTAG